MAYEHTEIEVPTAAITIGQRHRQEVGDLEALADSIRSVGLLQPIGLTPEYVLIFGERRLRACRDFLGWDMIPARLFSLLPIMEGEYHENELRKDFTVSERVAIGKALEAIIGNRQGQRTDKQLPQNFEEVPRGQETNALAAKKAGFGNPETYRQAKVIVEQGATAVLEAVDAEVLTVSAALPLTELPRDAQPAALAEATQAAHGKHPTAPQVRAAVSRAQVVATVIDHMAAGESPRAAVNQALALHEITMPTPALADAIAQATDRQVTLPATDGLLHDGRTKAEEAARGAQTKRLFQLFNALEALATLPDLEGLIAEIPDYCTYRVEQHLDEALATLTQFATLWKEHTYVVA